MDIQNPHDKFFKEVFSDKETAIDYFKHSLPPELSRNIDFNTLKQDKKLVAVVPMIFYHGKEK